MVVSRERYAVGYEPNYKFDDRLYAYGAALYESDRFLGYFDRYSASAGIGYGVVRERDMSLDITIGPAFRRTNYTDEVLENSVGARGSVDFDWNIARGLKFAGCAGLYPHRQFHGQRDIGDRGEADRPAFGAAVLQPAI